MTFHTCSWCIWFILITPSHLAPTTYVISFFSTISPSTFTGCSILKLNGFDLDCSQEQVWGFVYGHMGSFSGSTPPIYTHSHRYTYIYWICVCAHKSSGPQKSLPSPYQGILRSNLVQVITCSYTLWVQQVASYVTPRSQHSALSLLPLQLFLTIFPRCSRVGGRI